MKNWTIGKRIITGGAILIALLLVVGGAAIFSLSSLERFAGARLRDDAIPGTVDAGDLTVSSLNTYIATLDATYASEAKVRDLAIAKADEFALRATESMKRYENSITQPEDRLNFDSLKLKRAAYATGRDEFNKLLQAGNAASIATYRREKLQPAFTDYQAQLALVREWNTDSAMATAHMMVSTAHTAMIIDSVIVGASVLIGLALGIVIIRGTNRALRDVAATLSEASAQVTAASGQVSASSQSLAEGASEQAASLEETSASLEEINSMTKRNADSSETARTVSNETSAATAVGTTQMTEMVEAMNAIKTSSDNIAKIIKTIDEIAFQTNILALNAAVVADEVRALAQRAAQAAKETADKIDDSIAKSTVGVEISGKVAAGLKVITDKTREVNALVVEIATASKEQTLGLGQIAIAVTQLDTVTQSNASNAEETAASSEELNAQALSLLDSVGDLLKLVGGTGQPDKTAASSPARAGRPFVKKTVVTKVAAAPFNRRQPALAPAGGVNDDDFFKNS